MSRTRKGKRPIGYEYWSRRPLSNRGGANPGKTTMKLTHRLERAEAKRIIKQETEE